ncbi:MAG: endonuclease/exonuclease/phosphatase family protein [Pseudonocardia sp.]|nr:endonuclease/exonuclease/phosphatase family protein [Pseudonocardia sp.]
MRVATVNLASGRDVTGASLHAGELAAAVAELDADVVAVQEVDVGQPRSHRVDQPAVLAAALGATDWRYAATILGTPAPDPVRSWKPIEPLVLRSPTSPARGPCYGVALFSRIPVRRWQVLGLAAGRARLPLRAPDPAGGRRRTWWFPDEPRAAIAAELDGLTVIGTHLSFAPHTATRQLRRLQVWSSHFAGPVLVAGDLNLPGPLPAVITGGQRVFCGPTFPAPEPKLQLDHLLSLNGLTGHDHDARWLAVGDHRAISATVARSPGSRPTGDRH